MISLDPRCEADLRALILERTGIVVHDHQRDKLGELVRRACAQFGHADCNRFVRFLEENRHSTAEQEFLIGEITIGESYFFRDPVQIAFLRDVWLPRTLAAKRASGSRTLRIWSAGCSSGQELYTIAMLLHELLPDAAAWNLHLLGTDINTRVLSHAVRGRFPEWSFRATPPAVRDRYFSNDGRWMVIDPALRQMTKFAYLNLRDDSFPSILTETNALDLILCRNVFIYFDREVIRRVLEKFAACLVPGGFLQLGAADPMDGAPAELRLEQHGETFVFTRRDGEKVPEAPRFRSQPASQVTKPLRAKTPAPPAGARAQAAPPAEPPRRAEATDDFKALITLIRERRWAEADAQAERLLGHSGENAAVLQLKAKALANMGRLRLAAGLCERAEALEPLEKHTYVIHALVLDELDRPEEAERALRQALYLDRRFFEAYYQLGMLQLRRGERQPGLKNLQRALELAEQADPEREVHNSEGMTCGRLADILRTEISIYARE